MDVNSLQSSNFIGYSNNKIDTNSKLEAVDTLTVESRANQRQQNDGIISEELAKSKNIESDTKDKVFAADDINSNEQSQIETAFNQVSEFVQTQNRLLNFSFDEDSNRSIIKVTDSDSGEVIRQIPSEDVLKLAERINELRTDAGEAIGVLINRKV